MPSSTGSPAPAPDGLPAPARRRAIATLVLGLAASVLDATMVPLALPGIARDLQSGASQAVWVVNAWQVAVLALLLPLATWGDRTSHRRIYLAGLALFIAASAACMAADSLAVLVAARAVQGAGAAGVMAVNTALVRLVYPQRLLGRGIALNAVVVSAASVAGPALAAAILSVATWRWLFAVNLAIGVGVVLLGRGALPANGTRPAGAAAPLLPIDLLRIPVFRLSMGASIGAFAAQAMAFVALPFLLLDAFGRSPREAGLALAAWPLGAVATAPVAGRLVGRHPDGLLGGVGLAAVGIGLLLLAALPAHASTADVLWRMALCGAGFGLFQAPNNHAIVTSAPAHRAGAAGGMLGTARLTGQTLGAFGVALWLEAGVPAGDAPAAPLALGAAAAFVACALSLGRLRA